MKKFVFLPIFTFSAFVLHAQSADQGFQQLYYERNESAEKTFHEVLKQESSNAEAWYGLTKAYLLQDEANKAMDTLPLAPPAVKETPYYKVAQGTLLLQSGKKDEAAGYFADALKETKEKNAEILAAIAQAHLTAKTGDGNYALELLQKAINRDKKNPALHVQLGDAYRKLQNGSEAYKAYQKAIEVDDKHAAAYHQIGDIFLSQKNAELYVEYFNKAIAADPNYAPSIYRLYAHEFYRNPAKALAHYQDFLTKSDASIKNQYDLADLYYLNNQYDQAIQKANSLLEKEGEKAQARLYKLMAYSYAGQKDTAKALSHMQHYFSNGEDSTFIGKDYLTMGEFYSAVSGQDSLAAVYYAKGVDVEKDSSLLYGYYRKLADMASAKKDFAAQAKWLGKYFMGNAKANNVDLFNWGLAHFRAEEYQLADSVFGKYVEKYPEQSYGFYWQAKSKALQDTEMKEGLAIPAYQKLIEVLAKNTADPNYKKWMAEAYGYLAAYETNTEKDYAQAVGYFEKVLEVDPENEDARKYISLLEKNMERKDSK